MSLVALSFEKALLTAFCQFKKIEVGRGGYTGQRLFAPCSRKLGLEENQRVKNKGVIVQLNLIWISNRSTLIDLGMYEARDKNGEQNGM